MVTLSARQINHRFGGRKVLKDISFELKSGECLAITGPNGSGKSTLARIIAGLLRARAGELQMYHGGSLLDSEAWRRRLGYVAPYLQLYRELSARENAQLFARSRGLEASRDQLKQIFQQVGLGGREYEPLKDYSSGMIQRARYAAALCLQPDVLILDEPTSNLDRAGSDMVYELIERLRPDTMIFIATNEQHETQFADRIIDVA